MAYLFEKIINYFKKGGVKLGMVEELKSIADHPRIAVSQGELSRIQDNIMHYKSEYPDISYYDSDNRSQKRSYHSLNIPKVLSRKLSKLVFNEGVDIQVQDDENADKFINDVFKDTKFRKNFGEELEGGYAVGGLVLRPYYDSGAKRIKISYSKPDSFYPLNSTSNDINEMAFTTLTTESEGKKQVFYTLLEFHTWVNGIYTLEYELYRSEKDDWLGYKVGLGSLDKYKDLQPRITMAGFTRPLFVYIKLAGKNNKDLYSPLSLGIIDNSKRQIQDINDKYDQFMWEVRQSERKIIASEHFFKTGFDQKGQPRTQFDSKTTAYRMIKSDEPTINEFVPQLRSTEFIDTINFILRIIENNTGFSTGTISFDGQSVKTATEIISENSETFSTRSDNVLIVEEAIKELIVSIFELADFYDLYKMPKDINVNVDFDDGVFASEDAKLEYYGKATTMQMMPRYRSIMKSFGVSEKEAMKWVSEIMNEQKGLDPALWQKDAEEDMLGKEE